MNFFYYAESIKNAWNIKFYFYFYNCKPINKNCHEAGAFDSLVFVVYNLKAQKYFLKKKIEAENSVNVA